MVGYSITPFWHIDVSRVTPEAVVWLQGYNERTEEVEKNPKWHCYTHPNYDSNATSCKLSFYPQHTFYAHEAHKMKMQSL